ncbi:hypothetical protein ScPMuIL_018292 [Solemya velum]
MKISEFEETTHNAESPALPGAGGVLVSAGVVLAMCGLMLSCTVCFWYRRHALRKKGLCENILINLGAPSTFAPRRRRGPHDCVNDITSDTVPGITRTVSQPDCQTIPEKGSFNFDDVFCLTEADPNITRNPRMKKSKSMTVLPSTIFEEPEVRIKVEIHFDALSRKLGVTLVSICGVPLKHVTGSICCKIRLFPCSDQSFTIDYDPDGATVHHPKSFTFEDVTEEELAKSTLRFTILSKKHFTSKKETCVGEQFLICSDYTIVDTTPLSVSLVVQKRRSKRLSTSDKYLMEELGSLFLLLQYQRYANRMKVLVRKAKDLPMSDRRVRQPEHYITINLLHGGQTVSSRETRPQKGYGPIWNQPFLFDIPATDANSYSLEFILMRGKLYSKDGVLGHVTIGPDGPPSGQAHWQEVVHPCGKEVTQWHTVLPRFQF